MQSEGLWRGSRADSRGHVVTRPAGNDQQTKTCPSVPSDTAAQGLLGTCEWQEGIFCTRAHACKQHQQLCCFAHWFLHEKPRNTSSWPFDWPLSLSFSLTVYGLASLEDSRMLFYSGSQGWTNKRRPIYQTKPDCTDKCLYFWFQAIVGIFTSHAKL